MPDTATEKKLRSIHSQLKALVRETELLLTEKPKPVVKSKSQIICEKRRNLVYSK